jgi:tape measure domain-containing protein
VEGGDFGVSNEVDERIVSMRFNNSQFEIGIKQSMNSLDALKKSLNMDPAKKGLAELDKAGKNLSLDSIGTKIQSVNAGFLAMATVAVTALASITSKAIATGAQLAKSLTVDPVKMGLQEYETNLNAIQTILANTQSKGTNLDQVNAALQELNLYSDQTIYNFSEMAKNIGTFTAAGVDLDTSVAAIKGIANLAAVSGSNSQQASTAMYQLSQALATGKVSLMDWNSVVNAGMGGQVFQDALKETARAHGIAVDSIIEKQGSFRDSLQEGWITSEVLTETLSKFTGDLNAEQLKSMGYTDEQIQKIMQLGQTAQDAATKVKTGTQLIDTLKESMQSGWSQTWQLILGDFEEAKTLWTGVNNVLGGIISSSADARNEMLGKWKELGGRDSAIAAVQNIFNAFVPIVNEVKQAFREFFPPMTGERLFELTENFRKFTEQLKPSEGTIDKIARAFSGLFAIFQIAGNLIKGVLSVFGAFSEEAKNGGSSLLDFAAKVGDWLVNLNRAIIEGNVFVDFFKDVANAIKIPIKFIKEFAASVKEMFSEGGSGKTALEGTIDRVQERFEPFSALGRALVNIFDKMRDAMAWVWEFITPLREAVVDFFSDLGTSIVEGMQTMDFAGFLDLVNTGLFAGLVLIIRKFLSGGINISPSGGLIDSIKGTFDGLTGTLGAMQAQLKSNALLKIAGAVALLTASVVALSLIDSAKLATALAGLTAMFLQLAGTMALVDRIVASKGFLKLPAIAGAMILLSSAVLILSAAVKSMSGLEWEELAKGLTGVIVLLASLAGAAKLLSMNSGGLISASLGMIAVATAVKILASAVADFAAMDWATMARGFAGVGAALGSIALFTRLADMSKMGLAKSAGLILLAASLKILASAVGDFAGMDWGTLGRGLAGMAASLLIIAGAMALIPPSIVITAAGLVAVGVALTIMAGALKIMGGMSWEEIGKGLTTLAGSLLIIAGALYLMSGALPGALALIIVAGALALLAPVLQTLGGMSWEEIGKGLAALAATFLVLGVAAAILTPLIPSLLGLGLAIALIGAGAMLAGVGVLAFAAGITALAAAGAAGAVAITAIVGSIIGLIPTAIAALANGIVEFAGILANSGPVFVAAVATLLISLATGIQQAAPVVIDTLVMVIKRLIDAIAELLPYFVDKGLQMITAILNGIAKNLPNLIKAATDVVVNFINGIAAALPRIIQAGINLIISFVEGLARGIRQNTDRMNAAGRDLADAIVDGVVKGITSGASTAINAAKKMATGILEGAKNILGINSPSKEFEYVGVWSGEGTAIGFKKVTPRVVRSAENMASAALDAMQKSLSNTDKMFGNVDTTPVIRPVVDLTEVRRGAMAMGTILASTPTIVPVASYDSANAIAADTRAQEQAAQEAAYARESEPVSFEFTQINNSPKPLSTIEIYRQTKNQISAAKGALTP